MVKDVKGDWYVKRTSWKKKEKLTAPLNQQQHLGIYFFAARGLAPSFGSEIEPTSCAILADTQEGVRLALHRYDIINRAGMTVENILRIRIASLQVCDVKLVWRDCQENFTPTFPVVSPETMMIPSPEQDTVFLSPVDGRNFALMMFALCSVLNWVRTCVWYKKRAWAM